MKIHSCRSRKVLAPAKGSRRGGNDARGQVGFSGKDLVIAIGAVVIIALLVLLFLRPDQAGRRLVFGDLTSRSTTNHQKSDPLPSPSGGGSVPGAVAIQRPVAPTVGIATDFSNGDATPAGTNPATSGGGAGIIVPATVATLDQPLGVVGAGGGVVRGNVAGPAGNEKDLRIQPPSPAPEIGTRSATSRSATLDSPSTAERGTATGTRGLPNQPNPTKAPTSSPNPGTAALANPPSTASAPGTGASSPPVTPPPGTPSPSIASAPTQPQRPRTTPALTAPPTGPAASPEGAHNDSAGAPALLAKATPEKVVEERTADLLNVPQKEASPAGLAGKDAPTSSINPGPPAAQASGDRPGSEDKPGGGGGASTQGGQNDKKRGKEDLSIARPFDPQRGSNVVFVLDRSRSMEGEKSLVARHELVRALENLGPDKSFYVLFFPYRAMPASSPLPATLENIRRMTNWIFSLGHKYDWGGGPAQALTQALKFEPDTFWLLSDGKFSDGVSREVRVANASTHAKIHTIGFYSREGEAVLRQIAEENGGTYRFVPPPKETNQRGDLPPVLPNAATAPP